MAASFKTISIQVHCVANCIKINSYAHFFQDHCFSLFPAQWQDSSYSNCPHSTGPPRTNRWPLGSGRVTSPSQLEWCNIPTERWYASITGFLGTEGFKHWQHLEISTDEELRKTPENVFTAFANTLEVSMSHWNYIDELYSDIRQGEQETTDQLDQCIKMLVERCGYMSAEEKTQCRLELLFHAMKHFEVKKWVRLQTALNKTVTFDKLLQHAKQHEAAVKDFQ